MTWDWGGFLSGLGQGINSYAALQQAQEEARQLSADKAEARRIARQQNAQDALAPWKAAGVLMDPLQQHNFQTALDAPNEPDRWQLGAIGNADASARATRAPVRQALDFAAGQDANAPFRQALDMASLIPGADDPSRGGGGSGLSAWYQNMTPRGVGGASHVLGPGISLQDPIAAGPVTADVRGRYDLRKTDTLAANRKYLGELDAATKRGDIRYNRFPPRSGGGGDRTLSEINAEINDAQQNLARIQKEYPPYPANHGSPVREDYLDFGQYRGAMQTRQAEQGMRARLNSLERERDALTGHPAPGLGGGALGGIVGPNLAGPTPPQHRGGDTLDPRPGETEEQYADRVGPVLGPTEGKRRWLQGPGAF